MRSVYSILTLLLFTTILKAQQPQPLTGKIELDGGRFVIESFTVRQVGDSLQIQLGDIAVMNPDGPTVSRFDTPLIIAVPKTQGFTTRKKIDPREFAGQLRLTVVNLEEQGDELVLEIEIRMERDVMNRRLSFLIIPEINSTDSLSVTAAGLLVNGSVRDKLYRRKLAFRNSTLLENLPDMKIAVTCYTDTLIRYNLRMPYQDWMDEASLEIHQVLGSPAGKEQLYSISGLAQVRLQPREPYLPQPLLHFILPEAEQKQRRMQGQAFLDFQAGRSVIVPNFRRNPEELAKIEAAIRQVQNDEDVEIVGLFVEGYASPEGSYALNERLARERSLALSEHISKTYGIPADIIRTSSVAEDWDGLRILVEESDLVRKAEVLAVIDGSDEPDRKEQRLRAMGWPWTAMLHSMFPQLRRVEYQIDFTVKDYTLEEAAELAGRNPEMLSQRELFLLAQSYEPGSPLWEQTLETLIRLYLEDPTAIHNYAALLIHRQELAAAKRYLDRIADHTETANNLGVYYLLSGDLDQAESYLRTAQEAGITEAGHNLEEWERKRENSQLMERYKR
ncbi:MAG: DUF3868 domain-containing protein [Bacteroides sp.]|nr:DUF3868 domain-containing protein [Bacteroides sp.]